MRIKLTVAIVVLALAASVVVLGVRVKRDATKLAEDERRLLFVESECFDLALTLRDYTRHYRQVAHAKGQLSEDQMSRAKIFAPYPFEVRVGISNWIYREFVVCDNIQPESLPRMSAVFGEAMSKFAGVDESPSTLAEAVDGMVRATLEVLPPESRAVLDKPD